MRTIPSFEIGVTNAWIRALAFVFFRVTLRGRISEKTERRISVLANALLGLMLLHAVFLPLPLRTAWFYTGLVVFLAGVVLSRFATVPRTDAVPDEPVTKGPYRYCRHPFYLAMLVQLIGMSIASASWVMLLTLAVLFVLMNTLTGNEEASCLERYGDVYREHRSRTPRWIGIPKPGRQSSH